MDYKTYEVNGIVYEHRPQVLGQLKQLEGLVKGISVSGDYGPAALIAALGDKAPSALAIILTEKGKSPEGKALDALAKEMEWSMSLEQTMEIADDFFSINPLSSAFAKIVGMMENFTSQILAGRTGSSDSASRSQAET